MEQLSLLTVKRFKDTVERILHVPGNYRGPVLEMAVVADGNLSRETLGTVLPQLLGALKQQGNVFLNVRFNYVSWRKDSIDNQVCPMTVAMTKTFYQKQETAAEEKDFGALVDYLKLFQARSKLIILMTDKSLKGWKDEAIKKEMQPFLDKKMIIVQIEDEDISIHYREL